MASYSGMSDYDIQLREQYKAQQAAAVTAAREAKKADYLNAMSQQTATGGTSNSNTGNASVGTAAATSSTSSGTGTSSGAKRPRFSGSTWNSSTGSRTGYFQSGNTSMPSYTSKLSGEDYKMREAYYRQQANVNVGFSHSGMDRNTYDTSVRNNYSQNQAAQDQVKALSYNDKLSDYDRQVRANFFKEVQPSNFYNVDTSASVYDQFQQVQNSIDDGEQALQSRAAMLGQFWDAYNQDPSTENKARYEQHWAQFASEYNAYNKLLDQYNKLSSAQGHAEIISDMNNTLSDLNRQLTAKETMMNNLSRIPGGNAQLPQLKSEIAALKEEIARYESARNTTAGAYYNLENQEQFQRLEGDDHMSAAYTYAQTAQEDLQRLEYVLAYQRDPSSVNAQSAAADMAYLQNKYGLDQTIRSDALYTQLVGAVTQAEQILARGGYDYDRMAEYGQMLKDRAAYEQQRQETQAYATEHDGLASVGSILMSPLQGVDYLTTMVNGIGRSDPSDYENYVPMNTYNMAATNYVDDVRSTVAGNIDSGVGKFLYQVGMGLGDSAVALGASVVTGLPNLAITCMGMSAASNEAKDILERGGSNQQAFWGGLAAGAAEAVFEKFSVDNLLSKKSVEGVKTLLSETFKQSTIEDGEEVATEIANMISDAVVMGDKSRFNALVDQYVSQGMSEEQAKQKATLDSIGNVALAGLSGFISGGVMGGAINGINYVSTQALGQALNTQGLAPQLLQDALSLPADTQAHQLAAALTEKLNVELTELGLELSAQYQVSPAEQRTQIQQLADAILSDQSVGELARLVEQDGLTDTQNRGKVDANKFSILRSTPPKQIDFRSSDDTRTKLIQELQKRNIKFTEEDLLFITKDATNQIVWLEKGNANAGLEHIVNGNGITKGHSQDFFNAFGIQKEDIPAYLEKVITNGTVVESILKPVGKYQGYERTYYYNGNYYVLVGIGTNGFIVSAYPKRKH